ncbi:Hypothetical protein SMAX5B_011974 [Scophthalmus maximus]|uniref:Secreted protein n=1 Tax=Scophthalmus maximus TaxID=52904 RepID=A0A2U9AZB4_SCOMX|nr:Hypothetical protein SMAX5B_011974 [Scophthalmus maximus]
MAMRFESSFISLLLMDLDTCVPIGAPLETRLAGPCTLLILEGKSASNLDATVLRRVASLEFLVSAAND